MPREPKLLAFYLPQFHPIPENDAWWGKGFTEWTNVVQGRPQFQAHYQPHVPADLGFYDLRLRESRAAQAALARAYGIDGFCYHYYWFGGKRLLEQPLEAMLADGEPDLPFCLCWANENWTRRWNGEERDVLIAQSHSPEDDLAMFADVSRHFADPRYIRIDGRPVFLVYRADILPDPMATVRRWREQAAREGLADPYLCAVQSFGIGDPTGWGFDAAVAFPPHGVVAAEYATEETHAVPGFKGRVFDYLDAVRFDLARAPVNYPRFPCVMPSWDNTARRRQFGHCYQGSHPMVYRAWLADAIARSQRDPHTPAPLVFINAWNEWAEGCHLEPDLRYGHAWLQATQAARHHGPAPDKLLDGLIAGLSPASQDVGVGDAWEYIELDTKSSRRVPPSRRQRFYLSARGFFNRWPRLKKAIRPFARFLGFID
ncbi:glycoside hydrolase family 99-like domain-containing protein [Chitinimonas sp. BJYL2]|uniref:glycosyltransferase WbsX family protein n=1 Tax=Chitinimonas sp. BJYL2 TaxID=2976696 RepID=UPI0022B32945|nr:glycoside hydrolase family 99-like domain-containing protein [Chitinimonas sp. BJYL2]